jgi:glutaredoxin 3
VPRVRMYLTDWCPFCQRAKELLKSKGVTEIEELHIVLDANGRAELQAKTGRRTVPQIYIGDLHVGGCQELFALDNAGQLDGLLLIDS